MYEKKYKGRLNEKKGPNELIYIQKLFLCKTVPKMHWYPKGTKESGDGEEK